MALSTTKGRSSDKRPVALSSQNTPRRQAITHNTTNMARIEAILIRQSANKTIHHNQDSGLPQHHCQPMAVSTVSGRSSNSLPNKSALSHIRVPRTQTGCLKEAYQHQGRLMDLSMGVRSRLMGQGLNRTTSHNPHRHLQIPARLIPTMGSILVTILWEAIRRLLHPLNKLLDLPGSLRLIDLLMLRHSRPLLHWSLGRKNSRVLIYPTLQSQDQVL